MDRYVPPRRLSAALATTLAALLLAALAPMKGHTAQPGSGTVGPGAPEVTWERRFLNVAKTFFGPDYCPPERDPNGILCDHFTLTVDVPPSYWEQNEGGVRVSIEFDDPGDEFDLHIYKDGKIVASSAVHAGTGDEVLVSAASGTYEVRVTPEEATTSPVYRGKATFVSKDREPFVSPSEAYHGLIVAGENPGIEPLNTPVPYNGPPLRLQAVDVGRNAGEPTIGIDPSGTAFYAAVARDGVITPLPGTPRTRLLRSRDEGLTWEDVSPALPDGTTHHQFTGDPHMHLDPVTGRVFFLDWLAPMVPEPFSHLSITDDEGQTYDTAIVSDVTGGNDRPALTSGRVPEGSPLLTLDPEYDRIVYLCVNNVTHSACSRSLDGGKTFLPTGTPPYTALSNETAFSPCSGIMGDPQTDPDGRLIIPKVRCIAPGVDPETLLLPEAPWSAVSEDAGLTWRRSLVSEKIKSYGLFSQVASDGDGNLYYVWWDSTHRLPYLAISTDHGQTWSAPRMIAPPGVHEVSLMTIAAGDRGRVAILFPGTTTADHEDLKRPWNTYIVISTNALDANPLFVSAVANPASDPVHRGDCEEKCAGMLDFLDIQVSPADGSVWAAAVDTCTRLARCDSQAKEGQDFSTGDPGVAIDSRGIAIHQLSGPRLRGPLAAPAKTAVRPRTLQRGALPATGVANSQILVVVLFVTAAIAATGLRLIPRTLPSAPRRG